MSNTPLVEMIAHRAEQIRERIRAEKASTGGRTRIQIAESAGISPEMLSYFMTGARDLSPATLDRLFEAVRNKQKV